MLRSFRVANHKSIRDEQDLLLLPAYDKTKPVVPVAGIFGGNASGKSNVLGALGWMRAAVLDSYARWRPDGGVPRDPYVLDDFSRGRPSHYSVDVLANGVRYTYGFEIDDDSVREEWLYAYPVANRKRVIVERDNGSWRFGSSVPRGRFEVLRELTRDNALFLSVAAQSGVAEVEPVYRWFSRAHFSWPDGKFRVGDVLTYLGSSPENRARLVSLTRAADLGIVDVRATPIGVDDGTSLMLTKPDIEFVHGTSRTVLQRWQESRGTLHWLGLLVPAFTAFDQGSLLCVDEIDASLHPLLIPRLIDLFRQPTTNPRGAQLVFTTHDATLLGRSFGEEILARDEIWFVEKDRDGATALRPQTDFHPRTGESTERRYLGGSYGAVPDVSEYDFRRAASGEEAA